MDKLPASDMSFVVYKRCAHKQKKGKKGRKRCSEICDEVLPCGHKCTYVCHMNDPLSHLKCLCKPKCDKKCSKNLHICGKEHDYEDPCPPCTHELTRVLPCSHEVIVTCSSPKKNLECHEQCEKMNACGHYCLKKCGEFCGLCETIVTVAYKACRHTYTSPCHSALIFRPCDKIVLTKAQPKCGHQRWEVCFDAYRLDRGEKDSYLCKVKCEGISGSGCGHECIGNCTDCFQGRFHQRCGRPCDKKHLYCPHWCMSTCCKYCPPCKQPCEAFCEHQKCKKFCGSPCNPCKEKCSAGCPHSKCSKLCSEPCNRAPCLFPCPKKLKCGHFCIGYCGDPCPPLCRVCDKAELEANLMLKEELQDYYRFVYIESCGHTVEIEEMNSWMSIRNSEGEIKIASCPICRRPIYNLKRYSPDMVDNFNEIREIKVQQVGESEKNRNEVTALVEKLLEIAKLFNHMKFAHFKDFLVDALLAAYDSMAKDEISFMKTLVFTLENAEDVMAQFEKLSLNEVMFQDLENLHRKLFRMIESRPMPLQPLEIQNLNREISRVNSAVNLFKRVTDKKNTQLLLKVTGDFLPRNYFKDAYKTVMSGKIFTEENESFIAAAIAEIDQRLHYEMGIDESERHAIIASFTKNFTGRWCKCPKGHIYVITECGGAMEMGQCNECGSLIGGTDHSLLTENSLAPEMQMPSPMDNNQPRPLRRMPSPMDNNQSPPPRRMPSLMDNNQTPRLRRMPSPMDNNEISPLRRMLSSMDNNETPPLLRNLSPMDNNETPPLLRMPSPMDNNKPPRLRRMPSPMDNNEISPLRRMLSSIDNNETPPQLRNLSPMDNNETPPLRIFSPMDNNQPPPRRRMTSPMDNNQPPPRRRMPSPMDKNQPLPLLRMPSPMDNNQTPPLRRMSTPIDNNQPPPLRRMPSAMDNNQTPPRRRMPSPMDNNQTPPLRRMPSPMDNNQTPPLLRMPSQMDNNQTPPLRRMPLPMDNNQTPPLRRMPSPMDNNQTPPRRRMPSPTTKQPRSKFPSYWI